MFKKFISLLFVSQILYLGFYGLKYITQNSGTVDLYLKDNTSFVIFLLLFCVLFCLYVLISRFVTDRNRGKNITFKHIFISQVILYASLLFVWNVSTNDLHSYIFTGRIMSKFSANPYIQVYDNFAGDVLYNDLKTIWSDNIAIYGPLTLGVGSVITGLGGDRILTNIILFKVFFLTLGLFNTFLIYKITKSKNASFLYAWNPLIVFEFAINAHNDVLLCTFLLLAICFLFNSKSLLRSVAGNLFLIAGFLTKYLGIIFFPFVFVYAFFKQNNNKQKILYTIFSALFSLALILLFYLPFGSLDQLLSQINSYSTSKLINPSVAISVLEKIYTLLNFEHPYFFARKTATTLFLGGYVAIFLYFVLNLKKVSQEFFLKVIFCVYFLFFLTMFGFVNPWYMSSILVVLILYLSKNKIANWPVHLLTLYSVSLYFVMR